MLGRVLAGLVPWTRPAPRKVVTMKYGLPEDKPPIATIEVVMLRDATGCPDGFTATAYAKGRRYRLPESLARSFFSGGAADPAEAHAAADLLENKRLGTEGLDKGPTVTHAGAATAATERADEASERSQDGEQDAEAHRQDGRSRRPRRLRA